MVALRCTCRRRVAVIWRYAFPRECRMPPGAMRPAVPASQQPQQPFDAGNPLLGEQPAILLTSLVNTLQGQRLAATIRTPSATVTVFLAAPTPRHGRRSSPGIRGDVG